MVSLSGFLRSTYAMTVSAKRLQEAEDFADEAYSQDAPEGMDEMTAFYRDCFVLANLKEEMTDKTVLIVTHRRAALDICNRVLHFAGDGECAEVHA